MIKEKKIVKVGIADLNIVTPPDIIRTAGLGSCVGVVIYDSSKKIAGLAHVLLPESSLTQQSDFNKYKYADTAVPILIEKLLANGARKYALKAKMAGGAQMFQFASNSKTMRIGARNIEAVKEQLTHFNIPIISSDVGGNVGRTIEFDLVSCQLKVRKVNQETVFI
ncbi:chemotaxis protein CheD [Oceanobacillus caeni]|uniref:Probable chemoreceptor glutamine deamidase CheD n=1 Tax=Oceanobacillus caeni TaxID=405946 RepID=A0ABR5MLF3_9BACI|nr:MULTISPECIES: chemotaxis protein CheD [Bacillaceae]KKE78391.1 chemotaxis protein CheD [Bacilli bacterium VT-13-104]PZD88653.1 chemotaxis protein CheD [Bacilli bacterium]KPH76996.1 chemotaxis protein CheD [Oceanobacillus caeni]MBU8790070.1 chemotaxis protein CheD [Oceanobacillus caeni]MCR1833229.1 chemotaxis protein CheD [Oceanobacillus caeni]